MLQRILKDGKSIMPGATDALLALSAWDVVIHIMAPSVHHDPVKVLVMTEENPRYFSSLTTHLSSDHTLWLLGLSTFAKDLAQYESVPAFLKTLVHKIQGLKPSPSEELTP
ncbi:hypothetical protein Plhal703r1_c09g0047671 [Plasmopara halstedii]